MSKRQEYAEKLKAQIDEWNAELDHFEAKAEQASTELKKVYEDELAYLRQRRDAVAGELARVHKASDEAWDEVWKGAEDAWSVMKEAFSNARSKFRD